MNQPSIRHIACAPLLTLALAVTLCLAPPAAAQAPTALDVGPAGTPMVLAVTGIGTLETQLMDLIAYAKRAGLEDPGLDRLRAEVLKRLGKKKGTVTKAIGIAPTGDFVVYGVPVEGRPQIVIAVDVVNREALIKAIAALQEEEQWTPHGEKKKKARVERRQLPGGGLEAKVAIEDRRGMTLRFAGKVAVMSDKVEALDAMRLVGGSRPAIAERLRRGPDQLSVVFQMLPLALLGGMSSSDLAPLRMMELVEGTMQSDSDGVDVDGRIKFSSDLSPWLALAKPGPAGRAARASMRKLAGEGTDVWMRWSVDPKASWEMAQTMLGDAMKDVAKEFKQETGLELKKDIVDVASGDLLIACEDGPLDCIVVMGAIDEGRAASSLKKLLVLADRKSRDMGVRTKRTLMPGGRTAYLTTFSEEEEGEPSQDVFQLHWGTRDNVVIAALTRDSLLRALSRDLAPAADVPEVLGQRGFGDTDVLAVYQRSLEPTSLLRQFLPILRGIFPRTFAPGIVSRALELMLMAQDQMVDGATIIEAQGLEWTLKSRMRALPGEGSERFDQGLADAWLSAMALRYQGRYRASNEALLALAQRSPDSPWGKKALSYVLSADDAMAVLTVMLGLSGGLMRYMMLSSAMPMEEAIGAQQASSTCQVLESMTCAGPGYSQGSCQIALAGGEPACEQELQAVLTSP